MVRSVARSFKRRLEHDHRTRPTLLGLRRFTNAGRVRPSFFVIGAQKCGTTSLFAALTVHPQVVPPLIKETHFLDLYGDQPAGQWHAHFPHRVPFAPEQISGEATPLYLSDPAVPALMAALAPDAKFIVTTRDPAQRAFSEYNMKIRRQQETLSFEDALLAEEQRCTTESVLRRSPEAMRNLHYSYVARGIYSAQVRRWFDWFPREQFHFLTSTELATDQQATLQSICDFLEIDPMPQLPPVRQNSFAYSAMSEWAQAFLADRFANEADDLAHLIGKHPHW